MGRESRQRTMCLERIDHNALVTRGAVRSIAIMALLETLLIDLERTADPLSRRRNAIKAMQEKLEECNKTYVGRVGNDFISYCDRYLCGVQDLTDRFFDDITEHDLLMMERVKSAWGVEVSADER